MTPRDSTPDPSERTSPVDVPGALPPCVFEAADALAESVESNGLLLDELSLRLHRLSERIKLLSEDFDVAGHGGSFDESDGLPNVTPACVRRPEIHRRHLGGSDQRGSTLILALVLCAIFAAVVWACLSLAPDVQPILEQVDNSVGQFIEGAR